MRKYRVILFPVATLTVLLGLAFALTDVITGDSARPKRPRSPGPSSDASSSSKPHLLSAGLWRTDGGFVSTIRIKNILVVAPIQVNTVLFMADGTPYALPPVTVATSGVATININDALDAAPQAIAPHVSRFGSATLTYDYPSPGHVVASVAAIDTARSLSFIYQVMEPMPMPDDDTPKVLEGLWWKRDRGVSGSVSLANATDESRTATLRFIRSGEDSDSKVVQLSAHTTQVLDLEQISREESDRDNRAGGIRVEYNGPRGAILLNGSLANESEGYSANMPFWSHNVTDMPAKIITMGSAGMMVGRPDPMMMPGFPAATRFEPYLSLRNTTSERLEANLQVNYMTGMEGAAPVNRQLSPQLLRPLEAKQVKLNSLLDEAGLKAFNGMINLSVSFTGHGGDLIVATGSVDQTGTYVFEVAPQVVGSILGKITGYWSVAQGNDAMYNLWNPSDTPQDVLATFYYGDGSGTYQVPVHLDPQASAMLDVAMLIMEKKPDPHGNIIPSSIQEGSASFASADTDRSRPDGKKRLTLVVAGGLFNVSTATCGEICQYCDGYSNFLLINAPFNVPINSTMSASAQATDAYGSHQTLAGGSWTTTNSAIMTVNSQGTITGVSVGQVTIQDLLSNIDVFQGEFCVNENMNDSCPTANESPQSTAAATPHITSISPAQGLIGNTVSVTIAGSGFGSSPIVRTVQGITPNIQSSSDSQIVANFVISPTSPVTGNSNVTVDNQGLNIISNGVNFYIQVPTKLVRTDYPGIPNGYGPLVVLTGGSNGNVVNAGGQLLKTNQCGMYRNLVYSLQDQQTPAQDIDGTYTLVEMFSNYSSTFNGTIPPTQNFNMTPGGLLNDIQFIGKTAPSCPGSNDNESFTQSHKVLIGTGAFPLTTVNSIQRGNYSGVARVDVTITTP